MIATEESSTLALKEAAFTPRPEIKHNQESENLASPHFEDLADLKLKNLEAFVGPGQIEAFNQGRLVAFQARLGKEQDRDFLDAKDSGAQLALGFKPDGTAFISP